MKKIFTILLATVLNGAGALAQGQEQNKEVPQRQLTVVDVETLVPVAGANVVCKNLTLTTDSMGIVNVPKSSKSLNSRGDRHLGYSSRHTQVPATIALFMVSSFVSYFHSMVFTDLVLHYDIISDPNQGHYYLHDC